ncbi:hypothetical protein CKO_03897 [Citrobacter koseri ATCC BAA-895]|uniref:Uncharacterized protein n=1 Tax=Citrobacter koseri (strain ATCC BAA-895 / CDC 4225-83 / SGSC4696) TaxID=290338 RepID=A8ANA9_CITK8|nr:hypothetical protein CKO_03897 [Citrobacter koseri ATCC BAA-895]
MASASRSAINLSMYSFFTLLVSAFVSGRPCAMRARSSSVFSSRCSRSVISFWVMRGSAINVPSVSQITQCTAKCRGCVGRIRR